MLHSSKQFVSTFTVIVFGLVAATVAAAGDPVATGDWSDPVDGLRSRLHVAFESTKDSPREAIVYLELQISLKSQRHWHFSTGRIHTAPQVGH